MSVIKRVKWYFIGKSFPYRIGGVRGRGCCVIGWYYLLRCFIYIRGVIKGGRDYLNTTKDKILHIATILFLFLANEVRVNVCKN